MSTSSHPGLSFGINRLGRATAFPPTHPPSKPSPSLPQHASPYQPQAYTPQQAPQGSYPHHLFQTAPSAPQVGSVPGVQNGARPPQSHASPALPGRSQRPSAPRQMPPQANPPLSYMQQSMNPQPLSQQPMNPQQMSQQSMNQPHPQHQPALASQQPMNPQQINQQSMNQPHPQHQPALASQQSMPQQPLSQPPMSQQSIAQQSIAQQPLTQQTMAQQPRSQQQPHSQPPLTQALTQPIPRIETPVLSQQSTPRPPPQQTLPPTQAQIPQISQISQAQQVQQVQQAQQVPQQPTPPQPAPVEPVQDSHPDDDMEIGSQDGEDGDSLEPKLIDGTPFVPRSPMGELMSAPPEGGSFPTLEAVHKHVLAYCTSVGYAIVIGRSKKTVPGLKKVLFVCDRAGKPPRRVSPEMRKRKTSSRKCDCQFGFFAIEQRTQWTVRYRPDPIHLKHNHGPSESPLLHPAARKLDNKMVAAVKTLKDSGIGVSQTLEILQAENPHVPLLPRDIYNARAAINRNPQKVATGLAENRAAIYSKPHPSAEERIRADLRREIQKTRDELDKLKEDSKKEIDELKEKIREKDKIIERFEMFIDICNQRVMVRLSDSNNEPGAAAPAPSS